MIDSARTTLLMGQAQTVISRIDLMSERALGVLAGAPERAVERVQEYGATAKDLKLFDELVTTEVGDHKFGARIQFEDARDSVKAAIDDLPKIAGDPDQVHDGITSYTSKLADARGQAKAGHDLLAETLPPPPSKLAANARRTAFAGVALLALALGGAKTVGVVNGMLEPDPPMTAQQFERTGSVTAANHEVPTAELSVQRDLDRDGFSSKEAAKAAARESQAAAIARGTTADSVYVRAFEDGTWHAFQLEDPAVASDSAWFATGDPIVLETDGMPNLDLINPEYIDFQASDDVDDDFLLDGNGVTVDIGQS